MLIDNILNPMGVLIFGGVSGKVPSFIPRSKPPIGLLGATKVVCEATLFSTKTMAN
jgi:hypothetical protein